MIENNISISIECEGGIDFGQFLARKMVAKVARSETDLEKSKTEVRCVKKVLQMIGFFGLEIVARGHSAGFQPLPVRQRRTP